MSHISQPQPSFGERRGHKLAPLQTDLSRPSSSQQSKPQSARLQRPRPTEYRSTNGSEEPVPLTPAKRQSSKSSLRSLFGRDKGSRAAAEPDTKLAEIEETQSVPQTAIQSETPLSPETCATPRTTTPSSTLTSPTGRSHRPRNKLKSPRRANFENQPKPPPREQCGWKPPPLFKAFPQSIKHEALSAPALSADSILRLQAAAGKGSADDRQHGTWGKDAASDAARKKKEQKEKRHMRTVSGTINKVEWSRKIYVLATTGYVLQYAGDGKHDRLPEKMLQLGPQSVAFASDAIPGKHWVVQISQNPAVDTALAGPEPSKSRFSRFGLNWSHTRRTARSFLLVLDNPDAMISWLTAIRAEIEARGGPSVTTEKHSDDDAGPQLRPKSSVRQMVKKDPHRVSSLFLQPQKQRAPEDEEEDGQSLGGLTWQSRRSSFGSVTHRSVIGSYAGSVSGQTESTVPTNGSGPSFTSNDIRTSSFTSAAASGPPSVGNGSFSPETPLAAETDVAVAWSPPSSSQGKRQSIFRSPKMQASAFTNRTESPQAAQAPSTVPEVIARSTSPPAPNFSVPSFSKKFASRLGPTPISQTPSPSSVASFPRRDETAAEPFVSTISSPPLSPTYSVASSRHTDSTDTPQLVQGDAAGRRTLRVSNSEDALTRTVRASQTGSSVSRVPRATAPGSPESSHPPSQRPPSVVFRPGMGPQMHSEPQVQTLPPPIEPAPRTTRVSVLYPDDPTTRGMSRRKSMPGLTVGPPSAPPPSCPLPRLPSPVAAQAPAPWSSGAPTDDRFYLSSSVRDHVQDRRKSGVVTGAPSPSPGKVSQNNLNAIIDIGR